MKRLALGVGFSNPFDDSLLFEMRNELSAFPFPTIGGLGHEVIWPGLNACENPHPPKSLENFGAADPQLNGDLFRRKPLFEVLLPVDLGSPKTKVFLQFLRTPAFPTKSCQLA